jgi:hypothetical protein
MLLRAELFGGEGSSDSAAFPHSPFRLTPSGVGVVPASAVGALEDDDEDDASMGAPGPTENAESAPLAPTQNMFRFQSPPRAVLHPTDVVKRFSLSPLGSATEG